MKYLHSKRWAYPLGKETAWTRFPFHIGDETQIALEEDAARRKDAILES